MHWITYRSKGQTARTRVARVPVAGDRIRFNGEYVYVVTAVVLEAGNALALVWLEYSGENDSAEPDFDQLHNDPD